MGNELMIRTMDPILVQIYQIKDIEEIAYQDLMPAKSSGKLDVLPNLYVRYDGGKYLSLCNKDKYFDVFVRKVFQVYNIEKDRELIDHELDPFESNTKLKIDDRTKAILESGDLTKINNAYEFYDQKKCYEHSLIFQSDEIKLLLPIIKYHIKQIFEWINKVITFENTQINGYRNNYGIDYKLDGLLDMLLINFVSHTDSESYIYIRSRNKKFMPIEMHIKFNKTNINVETYFRDYDLLSTNEYITRNDNKVVNIFSVTKNNTCIAYKDYELSESNNLYPNITGIDGSDDVTWYCLPWNALYGVNNTHEELSDVSSIVMLHNKYFALVGDEFMIKEYISKEFQRKKTFKANANRVVMDEANKRIYGILLDEKENIYLLETYFANVIRSNGYYDSYLSEKYYYHIAQNENRLNGLNRNDLISINQDNNIIINADLLVIDDIKRLLKR